MGIPAALNPPRWLSCGSIDTLLDYYQDYRSTVVSFVGRMTAQIERYRNDESIEIQFVFNNNLFAESKTSQHETNLTNGSPEQSRVLRWTTIRRYNNTSQLCAQRTLCTLRRFFYLSWNDWDIRTVVLFIKTSMRHRSMSTLRDTLG